MTVFQYLKDRGATALEGEGPHPDWLEERAADLGIPRSSLPAWIEGAQPECVIPLMAMSPIGEALQELAIGHGMGVRLEFEPEPDLQKDLRNIARPPAGIRSRSDAELQVVHARLARHGDSRADFFTELRMLNLEILDGTSQAPSGSEVVGLDASLRAFMGGKGVAADLGGLSADQLAFAGVLAARAGNVAALSLLMQHGLSASARHCGTSLLENAASCGRTEMVRALLQAGASLDGVPLVRAAHMHRVEVVDMLVEAGAHPDHGHPHFASPLGMAMYSNRNLIAKRLIGHGSRALQGSA